MTNLEIKRLKVELLRVSSAKAELELRVEEAEENIVRLKGNIAVQEAKEKELQDKIASVEAT